MANYETARETLAEATRALAAHEMAQRRIAELTAACAVPLHDARRRSIDNLAELCLRMVGSDPRKFLTSDADIIEYCRRVIDAAASQASLRALLQNTSS
jgi:hypothetical protein